MKPIAAAFIAALSSASIAADYATCLLAHLPGVQNDAAANAAVQFCLTENPQGINGVVRGSGRGVFGYKSGAECAMREAANTRSQTAGTAIYLACKILYDNQNPFGDLIPKK